MNYHETSRNSYNFGKRLHPTQKYIPDTKIKSLERKIKNDYRR